MKRNNVLGITGFASIITFALVASAAQRIGTVTAYIKGYTDEGNAAAATECCERQGLKFGAMTDLRNACSEKGGRSVTNVEFTSPDEYYWCKIAPTNTVGWKYACYRLVEADCMK